MKKFIFIVSVTVLILCCAAGCGKEKEAQIIPEEQVADASEQIQLMAEEYFLNYMQNNWDKVYDYLLMPESEFTTKDLFLSMMNVGAETDEAAEIDDYTVTELPAESSYEKKYKIEYMLNNSAEPEMMEIVLIKQSNDSGEEYKVSPEEFLVKDYSLTVPSDSDVIIDGITVDPARKTSRIYEDEYLIDYIFNGEHTISITSDYLESVTGTFVPETGGSRVFADFEITESSLDEMCSMLTSMSNSIYNAAINKQSFESVRNLYASDCDTNKISAMYNDLYSEINLSDGGGLKTIEFSDIELRSDYTKSYHNTDFTFVGWVSAEFTDSYYNASTGRVVTKSQNPIERNLPNQIEAIFRYLDGKWQVEILYVSLHSSSADLS